MSNIVSKLRNGKEGTYRVVTLVVGILLWPLVIFGVLSALASPEPQVSTMVAVYLVYAVLIWIFLYISSLFYRAHAFGNMVLLGPKQFPELHAMVTAAASELGFKEAPKTFLYNSNGLFNAFARRLFGGRYVFLTSALVDANSDEQVRFVIGHELGHHAAGHLNAWLNFLRAPSQIVPFLNAAYSRSREYTCDSIGAHLSKDLAASRGALQMLGCGCRRLNQTMSCEAFMAQEAMVPPAFGFLNEIFRSHPRLTRRVAAINERTVGASKSHLPGTPSRAVPSPLVGEGGPRERVG
jgi:Zn-dependent protease with chaperone function